MTTPTITDTSSAYARGVAKILTVAPETVFGTAPSAGSVPGQIMRRNSAVFNLTTQLIPSQEILPSQQMRDARQGPRSVQGTLAGNLSCLTYGVFWEALLRGNFTAGVSSGAITDTTATLNSDGSITFVSAATNFATSGFTQGDVVKLTGLTGGAAANNGINLRVVALPTALSMTVAGQPDLVGWATGQTVTVAVVGKKLIMPVSGQIVPSFSIEEWYGDVGVSEVSTGCRITQASINIPASGFASFSMSFTGQNKTIGTVQAYPSPAAPTATEGLTAVGGMIFYKGKQIAYINSLSIQIAAQTQADPAVGSNIAPAIFVGDLSVQGSFTCMMTADSMTADYLNEAEVDLSVLLTDSPLPNANFFSIYLPRVKLSSGTKTDSDRAITRSFNFMALENIDNPNAPDTSVVLQDTLA